MNTVAVTKSNKLNASVLAQEWDEVAVGHFMETMDAKELLNRNVLNIWADTIRIHGNATVRAMPKVGSDEKTNPDNPDIVKDTVQGTNGMKTVSIRFSWVLFDQSPMGVHIQSQIDGYTGAKNKTEGTADEFKGLGKDEYKSLIAKWTQRKTQGRNAVGRAISIEHMLARIETCCPSVGVKFLTEVKDDEEVFSASTKPVKLWDDSVKGGDSDVISVGTFLTLNPEKAAMNNEPNFKGLLKTAGGESEPGRNEAFKIETVDQFDMAISSIATFFDKIRTDKKLKLKWLENLNEGGNESLLSSLHKIESEIDTYTSIPAIEAKMQKAVAGEHDGPNETRRDRLAKAFAKGAK